MRRPPHPLVLPALALGVAALLLVSLALGSASLPLADVLAALRPGGEPTLARDVVLELRLPRALAALGVGALLALSGSILQVLLRNPLADPYVLGVSGGASVAALLGLMAGVPMAGVDGLAALGALGAGLLVFALAQGPGGWTPARLLLTGVVVAAGAGSIVSLLLSLSDDTRLRGMVFWLLGDLSRTDRWGWLLGIAAVATLAGRALGRHLNVLAQGETQAQSVGMNVRSFQAGLFVLTALMTGAAVSAAGSIGFIGLVTPHLVRMSLGTDHRLMLPSAALLGGMLLMAADLAARTIAAPRQLPVGALTALVGVPVFLYLMSRQPR
ncbi:MAG TPA: iron ABC transporter permease [Steroidobacteraceae bacterium]|nr:iron ABC transporter permease [Steroidobacteraceae bacterium]